MHEACRGDPAALANALGVATGEGDEALIGVKQQQRYVLTYVPGKAKANPVLRAARAVGEPLGMVTGEGGKRSIGVKGTAYLSLGAGATSRDVLQAMLQVAHLRHLPFRADLDAEAARRRELAGAARGLRPLELVDGPREAHGVGPGRGRPGVAVAEGPVSGRLRGAAIRPSRREGAILPRRASRGGKTSELTEWQPYFLP